MNERVTFEKKKKNSLQIAASTFDETEFRTSIKKRRPLFLPLL